MLERAAASNYWTEAEAQAVLETYEASGLSVAEFACRHRLVPQRLRWWKKRRAEEKAGLASFVPVQVATPSPEAQQAPGPARMEVCWPGAGASGWSLASARTRWGGW
ncbi:Hypothetical protein AA314_02005 [Archangium gephyra]|nr:Hypothetical protein AA314_02005 [Archangium gephyra]